jgi:hypothetical protein
VFEAITENGQLLLNNLLTRTELKPNSSITFPAHIPHRVPPIAENEDRNIIILSARAKGNYFPHFQFLFRIKTSNL